MNRIIKKLAVIFFKWKPACFTLTALLLMASCKEDPIGQQPVDGRRPDPIPKESVVAIGRPGGAYIFYKLPNNDTDISYVKGEFEINGEKQTVRASVYNNYLVIDGLDSHLYVEIDLYVVDHSENMSDPVRTKFITYDAPYTTMGNSIELFAAVGGVAAIWKSPNAQYQYYASMGYISSNYDSDVGIVLLVADDNGKMTELAVSFDAKCSHFQPRPNDTVTRLYGAYAMDKWGHYSDTLFARLRPMTEKWLNRRQMKAHYMGNDNQTLDTPDPNHPLGYYSPMSKLFDSLAYCFQPNNNSLASSNHYRTGATNPATGEDWLKPFYFTMDLGVVSDISRFWIAPKTHSDNDRFYEFSNGSIYDFELWGTLTDFSDTMSLDFIPAEDPYWTSGQWKMDPRWRYMGRYLNKRPSNPGDTPGNYTTEYPTSATARADLLGVDAAWTADHNVRAMGNGVRYLSDGSGPFQNDEFFFPDAGMHFAITETGVGPVRYVRWQINEVWEQLPIVSFSELWYWGGVSSENENNN
jgi:hypothetical protein